MLSDQIQHLPNCRTLLLGVLLVLSSCGQKAEIATTTKAVPCAPEPPKAASTLAQPASFKALQKMDTLKAVPACCKGVPSRTRFREQMAITKTTNQANN